MKSLKINHFLQLTLALVLCAAVVGQVRAEPTVVFDDGTTSVTLDEGLTAGLETLGVTVGASVPGTIDDANVAVFPIVAGAIDLATSVGDISHSGGLSFTSADGATVVDLLNFVIDNSSGNSTIALTGLVGVNDSLAGRAPLFNMDFSNVIAVSSDTELTVNGVALTLTAEAAAALNAAFAVESFTEGFVVGTADVAAIPQVTDDAGAGGDAGTDGGDAGTDGGDTGTDGATDDGATDDGAADDTGDDAADDTGDAAGDDTGDAAADDTGDDAADDSTDA